MHPFLHIGSIALPSYGVMMALAAIACGVLGCWRFHRAGQKWEYALAIMACAFGCAIMGAFILYMLVTYSFQELLTIVTTFSFPEGGGPGLVFLGGLLAAIPGVLLGCRLTECRPKDVVLPLVPVIPLGHALGRVGCFLAGCCYGKPTTLSIGVIYQVSYTGVPTGVPLLPVQLMEAAALLVIFTMLMLLARRCTPNRLLGAYAVSYAICRFVLETMRYDSIRGIYGGLSTSQWISIGLLVAGIVLLLPRFNRRTA